MLGLSLDACIKLKESKKLRTVGEQPSKRRRRKKRKQAMQKAANTTEPVCIYGTSTTHLHVLCYRKTRLTFSTF